MNAEDMRPDAKADTRQADRTEIAEPARIAFGGAAFDCALLDASPGGVRVEMRAPAAVPGVALLRLCGGKILALRRRWQRGAQAGFAFVGRASPPGGE